MSCRDSYDQLQSRLTELCKPNLKPTQLIKLGSQKQVNKIRHGRTIEETIEDLRRQDLTNA